MKIATVLATVLLSSTVIPLQAQTPPRSGAPSTAEAQAASPKKATSKSFRQRLTASYKTRSERRAALREQRAKIITQRKSMTSSPQ